MSTRRTIERRLPMPQTKQGVVLLCLAALLVWSGVASAGFEDRGGARALGLGSAFVGVPGDPSSPYWNPAGLSFLDRAAVTGCYAVRHMGLDEDNLGFFAAGVSYPTANMGTFALSGGISALIITARPPDCSAMHTVYAAEFPSVSVSM